MTRFAVVTGLKAEANLIRKAHARARSGCPALAAAGASGERAYAHATRLIEEGAEAVVSFGLCGSLDPALRPGDLVLAEEVAADGGRRFAADGGLRGRLRQILEDAGLPAHGGVLLGSDRQIASAEEKRNLRAATLARAVDMESHGVARAADGAGVPFAVVRAVADGAERNLPRAALKATRPDGGLRLLAVVSTMYLRPWEGLAMVRLAFEARQGFDALERAAGALVAELSGRR